MPFGFGRKKEVSAPAGPDSTIPAADARGPRRVSIHGLTEEWRLFGMAVLDGRLLDALNRREAMAVEEVTWAPADGSAPLEAAPGIQTMDPYDLIVVIAGPDTLSAETDEERVAHRVHKIQFDVAIEAPPFRIVGTIGLHPGSDPDSLLQRSNQMFTAVTDATVSLNDTPIELGPGADVVLVNRYYMRAVEQVDKTTGQPHQRFPGQVMGGGERQSPG